MFCDGGHKHIYINKTNFIDLMAFNGTGDVNLWLMRIKLEARLPVN